MTKGAIAKSQVEIADDGEENAKADVLVASEQQLRGVGRRQRSSRRYAQGVFARQPA